MKRRFNYWSGQGVKSSKFLSTVGVLEEQHLYSLKMAEKYGRVYGGYCLAYDWLVINEPELIKEVLVKHFDVFPDRLEMYLGASPYINKNLFFMAGNEDWKRIHSTITPTFTSSKLKAMTSKISSISDELIEKLLSLEMKGIITMIQKQG